MRQSHLTYLVIIFFVKDVVFISAVLKALRLAFHLGLIELSQSVVVWKARVGLFSDVKVGLLWLPVLGLFICLFIENFQCMNYEWAT